MSKRNFRFASPGVFVTEIDNSQIPRRPEAIGPTVIGRLTRGPGMQPVKVDSFSEFIEMFGEPTPGGVDGDAWRNSAFDSPTYAAYAAQAYLAAGIGPVNVVRLMGTQDPSATATGKAGWDTTNTVSNAASSNGGAYGLWVVQSASKADLFGADAPPATGFAYPNTGSLAAIFYLDSGAIRLSGNVAQLGTTPSNLHQTMLTAAAGVMIEGESNGEFLIEIVDSSDKIVEKKLVNIHQPATKNFIRKSLNTNPALVNSNNVDATNRKTYWLGETFERHVRDTVGSTNYLGWIGSLSDSTYDRADMRQEVTDAYTGWFFCQDVAGASTSYNPLTQTRLFKFAGINNYGEWLNSNIKIGISDIKGSPTLDSDFGSFTVDVRLASDSDSNPVFIERYTNCNLNPNSPDYIARRVGDKFVEFDAQQNIYRSRGIYENNSDYIRVVMNPNIETIMQDSPNLIPFGILGPPKLRDFAIASGAVQPLLNHPFTDHTKPFVRAEQNIPNPYQHLPSETGHAEGPEFVHWPIAGVTGSFVWPTVATRISGGAGGDGADIATQAYFGVHTGESETTDVFDVGYGDYLRALPANVYNNSDTVDLGAGNLGNAYVEFSWAVSLDDIVVTTGSLPGGGTFVESAAHLSGSRAINRSYTALSSSNVIEAVQAATATFTFTDKSNEETTITLTDHAGTSVTFETDQAGDGLASAGSGNTLLTCFANSAAGMAGAVIAAVNASALRITATTGGGTTGEVLLTMDDAGTPGNTTITSNLNNVTVPAAFTGGTDSGPSTGIGDGLAGGTYTKLLDLGVNRLLAPMFGGFNGLDITESEPFRNTRLDDASEVEANNYAFYSVKRAIDTIADPERLETNLVTMPGITNESLTKRLMNTCEARGDALAIIDLKGTFQPKHESTANASTRASNIDNTIDNLVARRINSSYACAYYPWVDIRDDESGGVVLRVPPSVVALGVFANTERTNDLWFAPAGFRRGGLTDGAAGLPDRLYEHNINPIASFPAEGVVIFGQKTLQVTPSALDRINVRRMLIFVKHEVSRIANNLLFDPNIEVTWRRFKSRTERLLKSVKSRFGISDFRVVLDNTTTTPDLVDRNILYAKVLVKPTQAIEFIAIDFVVTRTRQNFDAR